MTIAGVPDRTSIGNQTPQVVVALADGRMAVFWTDWVPGQTADMGRMQVLDTAGHQVGAEIVLLGATANMRGAVALEGNRLAVTFQVPGAHSWDAPQVVTRIYGADGTLLGQASAIPWTDDVVALPGGRIFQAWLDPDTGSLMGRVVGGDGTQLGSIQTYGAGVQGYDLSVAAMADGRLALAWATYAEDGPINITTTRLQVLSGSGAAEGGSVEVSHGYYNYYGGFGDDLRSVRVVGDAGGGATVVWDRAGSHFAVMAQHIAVGAAADGTPVSDAGPAFQVAATFDTHNGFGGENWQVTPLPSGGYVARTQIVVADSTWANVVQLLDAEGRAVSDVLAVPVGSPGYSGQLAQLGNGDIAFGFASYNAALGYTAGSDIGVAILTLGRSDATEAVVYASDTATPGRAIWGGNGPDSLAGTAGDDTLVGLGGTNTLSGGAGHDVLYAHAGDVVTGGEGRDVLYMADDTPASLALDLAGIEYVAAGFGSDTITAAGQALAVEVYAGGGADGVTGGSGRDWLWGGVGDDTLIGNAGSDILVGDLGTDSLSGGAGNDRMYVDSQDGFDGGGGFDAAYIVGGTGMAINLAATRMEWVTDFVSGNDTLDASGTTVGVELYAGGGNDLLTGGTGADLVFAGAGADTLIGGDGDDALIGEAGADSLSGGAGKDRIYADAADTVDGGDGYDIMYMVADAPSTVDLGVIHVEWLFAGAGNDSIASSTATPIQVYANAGADTLSGGGGNDTLWGGHGDDSLLGGAGTDTLVGEAGNDTIDGGAGDDGLFGGAGADLFVFGPGWGSDTIFDWLDGTDRIDARALASLGLHGFGGVTVAGSGSSAVLGFAGNTLTIVGAAGLIDAADFLFA